MSKLAVGMQCRKAGQACGFRQWRLALSRRLAGQDERERHKDASKLETSSVISPALPSRSSFWCAFSLRRLRLTQGRQDTPSPKYENNIPWTATEIPDINYLYIYIYISCPRMSTTAHLSWELPVERPKKRIIETKWQLARWPPTRARSEPEEDIKLHYWSESGVGGRGRKPFNIVLYRHMSWYQDVINILSIVFDSLPCLLPSNSGQSKFCQIHKVYHFCANNKTIHYTRKNTKLSNSPKHWYPISCHFH